jgi:6-phosphogluconolactonase
MTRGITKLLISVICCSLPLIGAWADGAVYAMTNALGANQVLVYHRADDGTLSLIQTIGTGGGGGGLQLSTVDSLGSQGSLKLDEAHHRLFAVNTETLAANNPGDCQEGTITSFLVARDGSLTLADRVLSGGLYPNSLTFKSTKDGPGKNEALRSRVVGDLLYVLNAGGPGLSPACGTGPKITGFTVDRAGTMSFLPGSVQAINPGALAGTGSGVNCPPGGFSPVASYYCGLNPPAFPRSPGEVRFTPDGDQLVVTVKGTNSIYVFPVGKRGTVGSPRVTQAPGPALPTYFGFAFDDEDDMILTEAFGRSTSIPASGRGAVSSFTITRSGVLRQISASIADFGTAACWVALEPTTGRYAYISNNLSNNISTYSVRKDGRLTLLAAEAASVNGPNDLAVVGEGRASFLYVLDSGDGTVGAFQIDQRNGSLTSLGAIGGLPANAGAGGLAAY